MTERDWPPGVKIGFLGLGFFRANSITGARHRDRQPSWRKHGLIQETLLLDANKVLST